MNKYTLWCIIYTSFGAFFYGYDSGLTTSIIAYPEFIGYFDFNATTLGALGSVYYAGIFLGAMSNAWLPDRFGRRRIVQAACVVCLLGAGMQTGAPNLGVLLGGRAIGGIANGLVWSLCPLYASEISPPHVRGRVGGLYNVNINASYALSEWMGVGFSYITGGDLKWRIFLGLQILPPLIMLVGAIWMPESPRWLVSKDRHDEALVILHKLHGDSVQAPGPAALRGVENDGVGSGVPFYQREFNQIKSQIQYEQRNPQLGIVAIMSRPTYRRRLYIIMFFFVFQMLTAIIPLQNYQVLLYQALGFDGRMPLILVGVWGTTALIVGIVGMYFFDRLGRRKSFFIAITIILIGSILLVIFWARFETSGNTNRAMGILAMLSMFVFLCGYGWIMNAFGYTYAPEILPMEIRATGMALGYSGKTALTIMLVQVTPIAIRDISWRYFMIFIFTDLIFLVGFYFFFPETANVPLEEVAAIFGDRVVVTLDEDTKLAEVITKETEPDAQARVKEGANHVENKT